MIKALILLHPKHSQERSSDLLKLLRSDRGYRASTEIDAAASTAASLFWVIDDAWTDSEILNILPKLRQSKFFPISIELQREVAAEIVLELIALDAFIRDRFLSQSIRGAQENKNRDQLSASHPSMNAPAIRILLADDHESNQILIKRLIEELGYECAVVENGQRAVEEVQRQKFDLVLMDCQMPVLDGIDATRQIRGLASEVSSVPILAVTANRSPGLRHLCHSVGMNGFISKPVDVELLKRCIHQLTRGGRGALEIRVEQTDQPDADIDASHLNQVRELDGSGAFMVEMIESFLVKLDPMVLDLEQKISRADWASTERAAHYLKSSAGNVGARALWHLLNQIEEYARAGNAVGIQAEWARLNALVVATRDAFTNVWLRSQLSAA